MEIKVPDFIKIKRDIKDEIFLSSMNICSIDFKFTGDENFVQRINNISFWNKEKNKFYIKIYKYYSFIL